ncbi:hypothetical protein [Rhodococcus phage RGL3]|uniref:Uncharacterized protein n=1 Tax=Rhodococcus phage RGL3 TaxID=2922221 RepID=G9FHN1_9CAUD|nr:hypothetical protein RoPhRGL3_gp39 [Rhodococcus phage RGL3]AEV52119.1 hypothetical protein [Rhodococcus phage RGL3]
MTDATNPDVYQGFSNGAQVIDITENLNGNGAQIVQYVARSTRIDGVVKDDPIEDLKKAKWFVERELARQVEIEAVKTAPATVPEDPWLTPAVWAEAVEPVSTPQEDERSFPMGQAVKIRPGAQSKGLGDATFYDVNKPEKIGQVGTVEHRFTDGELCVRFSSDASDYMYVHENSVCRVWDEWHKVPQETLIHDADGKEWIRQTTTWHAPGPFTERFRGDARA